MIASSGCISMPEDASVSGAALAGAGAFATPSTSSPPACQVAFVNRQFKCVTLMRHSIATSNEAAATSADAMRSVYLNEAYADSSLSDRGHALVRGARQAMAGLSPAPDVVLVSPLTRAIQTAIAMFGGTGIRMIAVPDVREAYGKFPCDRHRDKSELELMFGDSVDFSLCPAQDTVWSAHHREEMSELNGRVARFVDAVLRREEGHVFVVSHGVFMETAIRQLTDAHPGHRQNRVHNCEVHSFVFAVPALVSSPSSSTAVTTNDAAAATASPSSSAIPGLPSISTSTSTSSTVVAGSISSRAGLPAVLAAGRPQVEAYLAGQGLALACATKMPLQAVAHVNRVVRRFSGGGLNLTEAQFSVLLTRCGLGPQEIRWLFCAFDREGGGRVAAGDVVLALMAFYSGEGGVEGAGATGARARVGLMELRVRYQREMYGTPLANYEVLEMTFQRIVSTVLSIGE